jgi:eukaryotic-like serine/threonine-protein kinase
VLGSRKAKRAGVFTTHLMIPKLPIPTVPEANESTAPYAPGDLIAAKYRLARLLGEGGMGAVWAAHNVALDSPVAIKLIRGETDRESLSLRLQLEARAAARLGHPAIVRVFDIGQTDKGDPFIVMELLEGESLATKLDRDGRLTAIEAVQILLPIADALRAAHGKGIVHRDIKPDNIFLALEGDVMQPKLVDFGIAKLEQVQGGSQLTQHGVVVGSPDYMSPEQARGDDVLDYRTDVWAFSVVLYETVTGRLPFDATNYNALLRSILEDTPPTLNDLKAGDTGLSAIIEVGMAKDRATRWRSMHELGVALAGWLRQQGILEDAVGNSLDTKWINRRSEGRASRPSLGSIPDGVFGPSSGIAVTMRAPPGSVTPHAGGPAGSITPASIAAVPVRPFFSSRRIVGALLGLAVALTAAFIVVAWGSSKAPDTQVGSPATRAGSDPVLVLPQSPPTPAAPTVQPEPAAPSIQPEPISSPAAPSAAIPSAKPVPRRPAAPQRKPQGPSTARPPNSDLIAPY